MDKELRDKIVKLLQETAELSYRSFLPDQILALIKEAGYVKLAEIQTLPFLNVRVSDATYRIAQDDMLSAGWRKVERETKG